MHPSDVDELVQEVWILLIRRLPSWRLDPDRGTIGRWVWR